MAELILKVGSHSVTHPYQDGDIIHAPNNRQIGGVYIDHICDVRKTGFNSSGLRPDSLAREQRESVYQYKMVRVSTDEVKRINLLTGEEDILSRTPNLKGEAIDVRLYLKNRLGHKGHAIFGEEGSEYWYGGRVDRSKEKVDYVWNLIEGSTPLRRSDHKKWPLGQIETAHFCALSVSDFEDNLVELLLKPASISKEITLANRLCYVDYLELEEIAGPIRNKISNRNEHIDVRDFAEFVTEDITKVKGL